MNPSCRRWCLWTSLVKLVFLEYSDFANCRNWDRETTSFLRSLESRGMRIGGPERRGDRRCWWWSCCYVIISQYLKTVCVFELLIFLCLFFNWISAFSWFLRVISSWLAELEYTCMVDKPLAQDSGARDPLRSGSLGRAMIHQSGFKISPSLLATWFPLSCLIRTPDSFYGCGK